MYHAITYGYLLGELVRRVDGRTLGQFFRDEIAAPLGLEYWIGLPDEQVARVAAPRADGLPRGRRLRYRRRIIEAGREKVRGDDVFHAMAWPYALVLAHPDIKDPLELSRLGSEPWIWRAELPASNGIGTARALTRMYAMLAEGGERLDWAAIGGLAARDAGAPARAQMPP